jgi:septum site-determining protein MinC
MKPRRQAVVKGGSLPVLRIVVRDGDARTLRTDLAETLAGARPMLSDAIAVLDLREREARDADPVDLVGAVREAGVHLAAVLIGDPQGREALAPLGLPILEAPVAASDRPGRGPRDDPTQLPVAAGTDPGGDGPTASTSTHAKAVPPLPARLPPLVLTRPLRSGQRLYAQGRDAIVAAPTSRGSELIADGSVYAYSPIRGRVLAGASGDATACIVATHLDAELVAVAGLYRTLEPDDLKSCGTGPVSVTLTFDADGSERLTLAPLAHPPFRLSTQESRSQ